LTDSRPPRRPRAGHASGPYPRSDDAAPADRNRAPGKRKRAPEEGTGAAAKVWSKRTEQPKRRAEGDDGRPARSADNPLGRGCKAEGGERPAKGADPWGEAKRPFARRREEDPQPDPWKGEKPPRPQGDPPFKKRRPDGAPFQGRSDRPFKRREEDTPSKAGEQGPYPRPADARPDKPRDDARPYKPRKEGRPFESHGGDRAAGEGPPRRKDRDERGFAGKDEHRPRRAGGTPRRERKEFKRMPARAQAAIAVRRVLTGRSLTDALTGVQRSTPPEDRALIQELSYGALRFGHRLQAVIERLLERPLKADYLDVQALLLIGLYQLLYTRIPAYAAVTETVNAAATLEKAWARGLVNGVLRRFQREGEDMLAELDADPQRRLAAPAWLVAALRQAWPEQWEAILEASNQRPPMALRVNLARIGRQAYFGQLLSAALPARPIPEVPSGIVLDTPVDTERLPGFAEGLVSVQDGGAQLAAGLLDAQPGQRVLDACAAPGGKTGHLLERTPDLDLTALDLDGERLERVGENLRRLGLEAKLRQGDAARPAGDWAEPGYDRILADVPCSATGVIRRHPDIKWLRRAEDIPALAATQARILDALWPLLAPGGRMLYMTCSLLPRENEEQIAAFLQRTPDARVLPIDAAWGEPRGPGRQTLPGRGGMDGFFFALLARELT